MLETSAFGPLSYSTFSEIGGLDRLAVGLGDRHHPARRRLGRILDDDRLDEARDLGLGRRIVHRLRGSRRSASAASRRGRRPCRAGCVSMPYFAVPFDLERNVDLRNVLADQTVLIRPSSIRSPSVRPATNTWCRFAGFHDVRRKLTDLPSSSRTTRDRSTDASSPGFTPTSRRPPRLAPCGRRRRRAAHRVEVHHGRPAAAGDCRAEHRILVIRIVARQVDCACGSTKRRALRRPSAPSSRRCAGPCRPCRH